MNTLLGNAVSFIAACFTLASSWSRERRKIYLFQAAQCLLLAGANIFFASLSGVTTCLLCALRNLLLAYDRLTKKRCYLLVLLVTAIGAAANNRGLLGLLPVAATAVYSVVCLRAQKTKAIKLNIVLNLLLWAVYDYFILDYVSCAVDSVSALVALASLLPRERRAAAQK
jgi:hypothetical protein